MSAMEKQEWEDIHLLRVVACFMVILLHVSAGYCHEFSERWNAAIFYDSFVRPCVPLFLMITGFLLLPKQDDAFVFYRRRFGKILPPLLCYSAGYFFARNKTLLGFPDSFLSGPIASHFWYIYMLCGLYFVMPFLQKMYAQSSRKELALLLAAWAALYLVFPALSALSLTTYNPASVFHLTVVGYWGYVFLGIFLGTMPRRKCFLWGGLFLYGVGSTLTLASTHIFSEAKGAPTWPFMDHVSITTALASIGVFLLLKDRRIRIAKTVLPQLSNCSFGIYLIHMLIIGQVMRRAPGWIYDLSPWVLLPLLSAAVFLISFAIICPLKKIKFIRVVVG